MNEMNQDIGPAESATPDLISMITADQNVRRRLGHDSHQWFFSLYLGHYLTHQSAPFHREMFALTEDPGTGLLVLTAFRNSGKSTIMTLSLPLWAVLGKLRRRHVLILSRTMPQARQLLKHVRDEMEGNDLLRADLGPFQQEEDEWRSSSLVIPKYGARITAASMEQSIRGIRHGRHRPDLIILDDVEDVEALRTKESRDRLWEWFLGDVMPTGDLDTRVVVVGSKLHEDSLLMRLKRDVVAGLRDGAYREYPLLDEGGAVAWPGKFPTPESIEAERRKYDERTWLREFLLRVVPDEDQVVLPEWIKYYDELPDVSECLFRRVRIGVDLAVSERDSADYTAMVPVMVIGNGERSKVFVLPQIVNERMDFPSSIKRAEALWRAHGREREAEVLVESVAFQAAYEQQLKHVGVRARGVQVHGDKRTRLAMCTPAMQQGRVLFPRKGAERLIAQLVGFGFERHDDLADAFSLAVNDWVADPPRVKSAGPDDYNPKNYPWLNSRQQHVLQERAEGRGRDLDYLW